MKTNHFILVLFLNLIFYQNLAGQKSFEIGSNYILTSEKLFSSSVNNLFKNEIFHSFGLNSKLILKSGWFFKGALNYQNNGTKLQIEETTPNIPEGTGNFNEAIWRIRSIGVQVNAGYYFLNKKSVKIGVATGLNNLFVTKQEQEFLDTKSSDLNIYNDYLLLLNTNVDIRIQLSQKLCFNVVPLFQIQLNSNNSSDFKQRVIGSELGISYIINEK